MLHLFFLAGKTLYMFVGIFFLNELNDLNVSESLQ